MLFRLQCNKKPLLINTNSRYIKAIIWKGCRSIKGFKIREKGNIFNIKEAF